MPWTKHPRSRLGSNGKCEVGGGSVGESAGVSGKVHPFFQTMQKETYLTRFFGFSTVRAIGFCSCSSLCVGFA